MVYFAIMQVPTKVVLSSLSGVARLYSQRNVQFFLLMLQLYIWSKILRKWRGHGRWIKSRGNAYVSSLLIAQTPSYRI